MYYLIIEGQKYGPYSMENLIEYAKEERVIPESVVETDGGKTCSAYEIIDFNNFVPINKPQSVYNSGKVSGMGNTQVSPDLNNYNVHNPPQSLKGFNWGAFALPLFWGISNKVYLALICLIPYVGIIVNIYFGIFGNSYAWKEGRFKTEKECMECQKVWNKWGIAIFIVYLIIIILAVLLPGLNQASHSAMGY